MFDALLATVQEGDEVIVTDPTYVGMISRVRMAGAAPVLVPFRRRADAWRLDLDALEAAATDRTRALFVMNPSMPSGAVLDREEWEAISAVCRERGCWLIYNAAMERIAFDGRPVVHPAALPGLAEHVITVGSVSKEWRMIGWRVGWVAGPRAVMADVTRAHLFNVVTPVSLTQAAAVVALRTPDADAAAAVAEWQRRRDVAVAELAAFDPGPAAGGWSLLVDVRLSARAARPRGGGAAARARARGGDADGRLGSGQRAPARARGLCERAAAAPRRAGRALRCRARPLALAPGRTTIALPPPRRTGSAAASVAPWPRNSMPVAAPICAAVPVLTTNDWPRACSAAASGVDRKSVSVCVVALLR